MLSAGDAVDSEDHGAAGTSACAAKTLACNRRRRGGAKPLAETSNGALRPTRRPVQNERRRALSDPTHGAVMASLGRATVCSTGTQTGACR